MIHRVVLDANVWISAALKPDSVPGVVANLARDRYVQSVLSAELVDQVHRHLKRLGFSANDITRFDAGMREASEMVIPLTTLNIIVEKPSDNRVLECAVEGNVAYIVTGDRKHLLPMGQFGGIQSFRHASF